MSYYFKSERLGFRDWKDTDISDFISMGRNKNVMKYFPKLATEEESRNFVDKIRNMFSKDGFGLYAVELLTVKKFIGFIGFWHPSIELDVSPFIEIGWRLKADYWNMGYATEGAKRCLEFGFQDLNFKELYSMTAIVNKPSERVMQKIGMKKHSEFNHCKIDPNSNLYRHVLYKIEK